MLVFSRLTHVFSVYLCLDLVWLNVKNLNFYFIIRY